MIRKPTLTTTLITIVGFLTVCPVVMLLFGSFSEGFGTFGKFTTAKYIAAYTDPALFEILWNTVVTAIKANEQGVCSVDLKDTRSDEQRELATDGVFIFIGFDPNNKLVPAGTNMNANGYVVTDSKCETNLPGIYVIGDLREKYARQIVLSAADGCTAALAAAHYIETRKASETCELPPELENVAS